MQGHFPSAACGGLKEPRLGSRVLKGISQVLNVCVGASGGGCLERAEQEIKLQLVRTELP